MILVDLNQVLISNLMVQTRNKADVKPNLEMVRQMVLNSLRGFNLKFRDEYGEMVLCSDAADPWRREFFPHYKHGRRKGKAQPGYYANYPPIDLSEYKCDAIFKINIRPQHKEKFLSNKGTWTFDRLQQGEYGDDLVGDISKGLDVKKYKIKFRHGTENMTASIMKNVKTSSKKTDLK